MEKVIEIKCREKLNKETEEKFPIYCAKDNGGKMMKVKFRKNVENVQNEPGRYLMTVDTEKCNIVKDDFGEVLWVSEVIRCEPKPFEDTVKDRF